MDNRHWYNEGHKDGVRVGAIIASVVAAIPLLFMLFKRRK